MYCKWCGMESKDEKKCEWCGKPFPTEKKEAVPEQTTKVETAAPPSSSDLPPGIRPTTRGLGAPSPKTKSAPPSDTATTAIPSQTAKYPTTQQNVKADDDEEDERVELPLKLRLEKYLGIMLIILVIGIFIANRFPDIWLLPLFATLFASGLLLGLFRVIEYIDNQMIDVAFILVPMAIVTPLYTAIFFLLICLVRKDANMSILSLLASFFIIRIAIGTGVHSAADTITYLLTFNVNFDPFSRVMQPIPLCFLLAGWALASFSRPLNE